MRRRIARALPPSLEAAAVARAAADRALAECVDFWTVQRVRLVASELAANAVEHASGPHWLSIELDGTITIRVADGGLPFAGPRTPPVLGRGRGLAIVSEIAVWEIVPTATGKMVVARIPVCPP